MHAQEIKENLLVALSTLQAHKFRSFLTVLGVVVGTMTVIAVSSVLTGLNARASDLIERFGPNVAFITKFEGGNVRFGRLSAEERMRKPITLEDARAISELPSVESVTPQIFSGGFFGPSLSRPVVKYRGQEASGPVIVGVWASYPNVRSVTLRAGRFFSESENRHKAPVCVIGHSVADSLFVNLEPLEKELEVEGHLFRVVGVLERSAGGLFGGDGGEDRMVLVPYDTLIKMHPEIEDNVILARARSGQLDRMIDEITEALRRRRNVPMNKPDNFYIGTSQAMLDTFRSITAVLALIVIPISGAGLLVGGVGVMNIMLVSVTERTKEIGIRRAVGARRSDIVWQFLIEAMSLTAAGGVIGIAVGVIISLILNKLLPDIPSSVPLWSVAAGFGVSVAIGLIFGLWPAIKAARLHPIDALRYE